MEEKTMKKKLKIKHIETCARTLERDVNAFFEGLEPDALVSVQVSKEPSETIEPEEKYSVTIIYTENR